MCPLLPRMKNSPDENVAPPNNNNDSDNNNTTVTTLADDLHQPPRGRGEHEEESSNKERINSDAKHGGAPSSSDRKSRKLLLRRHQAHQARTHRGYPIFAQSLSKLPDKSWWWDTNNKRNDAREKVFNSDEPTRVFQRRVDKFRQWILSHPSTTFVVFGHSTFFKEMVGRSLKNCEVASIQL